MIGVGDVMPVAPKKLGGGGSLLKTLFLAICYVALVPAVCAVSLMVAAAYFPGPTRALLGPALENLGFTPQAARDSLEQAVSEASGKVNVIDDRLSKVEKNVLDLSQRITEAGQSQPQNESLMKAAVSGVVEESRARDRCLSALAAVSVSRSELLAGNWEVARREVALAQRILGTGDQAGGSPATAEIQDALAKASNALGSRGASASDWLSLAWHLLVEAAVSGEATP